MAQAKVGKIDQYILDVVGGAIRIQGNWNANTNTPDITGATTTGFAWIVSVAGDTTLGSINVWDIGDIAVKTDNGWAKIANQDYITEAEGDNRYLKQDQTEPQTITGGTPKFEVGFQKIENESKKIELMFIIEGREKKESVTKK